MSELQQGRKRGNKAAIRLLRIGRQIINNSYLNNWFISSRIIFQLIKESHTNGVSISTSLQKASLLLKMHIPSGKSFSPASFKQIVFVHSFVSFFCFFNAIVVFYFFLFVFSILHYGRTGTAWHIKGEIAASHIKAPDILSYTPLFICAWVHYLQRRKPSGKL